MVAATVPDEEAYRRRFTRCLVHLDPLASEIVKSSFFEGTESKTALCLGFIYSLLFGFLDAGGRPVPKFGGWAPRQRRVKGEARHSKSRKESSREIAHFSDDDG